MKIHKNTEMLLTWAFVLVVCYASFSITAYRFGHSDMTETQLLFHIWEALTWQW